MTSAIAGSGRQMSNVIQMVSRTKLERSQSQKPDGERCCTVVVVFVMSDRGIPPATRKPVLIKHLTVQMCQFLQIPHHEELLGY
jgi:hypothetical protein